MESTGDVEAGDAGKKGVSCEDRLGEMGNCSGVRVCYDMI